MGLTPEPSDRRSAEHYLRGNVLVRADLDPDIAISGYLRPPNSRIPRSAITPFKSPDSKESGHHIEVSLDVEELGLLAWPRHARSSAPQESIVSLGEAMLFMLGEGTVESKGHAGIVHMALKDAQIKVHRFDGGVLEGVPGRYTQDYVTFELKLNSQVSDADERLLQIPHPIRRLNRIFSIIKDFGYELGKIHAGEIHLQRIGKPMIHPRDLADESVQIGPWIFGEQIEDLKKYLVGEGLVSLPSTAVCGDGAKRYEKREDTVYLRLAIRDAWNTSDVESLCRRVRGFFKDQQEAILEGFYIGDEDADEDLPELNDANLGSIEARGVIEGTEPFAAYCEFQFNLPTKVANEEENGIRGQKIGLLFEGFATFLADFRNCFERNYTDSEAA